MLMSFSTRCLFIFRPLTTVVLFSTYLLKSTMVFYFCLNYRRIIIYLSLNFNMKSVYKITLPSQSRGSVILENASLTILKYWISDYIKYNSNAFDFYSTNEYYIQSPWSKILCVITRQRDGCCTVSYGRPEKIPL